MSQDLTRVIAVRHGETDWNAAARIQGHLDIALNDRGRAQAARLARSLAGESLDAVYASDLERAHATALAVAQASDLVVMADPGLRERGFGLFEGLTWAEVEQRYPEQARRRRRRDADFGPEGGETLAAFFERAVAAVGAIAERHRGQHIAIVTHGGVLDALYRVATRIALDAPRSWQLDNAAINRLLHGEQGFTLVGWGDTQHLDDIALDEAAA